MRVYPRESEIGAATRSRGFRRVAGLFLRWLLEYENWIEATCGSNDRRRCFERAPMARLRPDEGRAWLANYREALATLSIALPNAPSCTMRRRVVAMVQSSDRQYGSSS